MEYAEAVRGFYGIYNQLRDQMDLTHHTTITESEGLIEIWRGGTLVIRVEDEDTTNIWRRAAGYLDSMAKRHGCTGATE